MTSHGWGGATYLRNDQMKLNYTKIISPHETSQGQSDGRRQAGEETLRVSVVLGVTPVYSPWLVFRLLSSPAHKFVFMSMACTFHSLVRKTKPTRRTQ